MKYTFVLLLASMATLVWADESVDITDPAQISGLLAIQDNLDAVSAAIMTCMDRGGKHAACVCEHRELVSRFNASVRDISENHPDLEEYDLVRFRSPEGVWVSQSLKGLRKQAATPLSCE